MSNARRLFSRTGGWVYVDSQSLAGEDSHIDTTYPVEFPSRTICFKELL